MATTFPPDTWRIVMDDVVASTVVMLPPAAETLPVKERVPARVARYDQTKMPVAPGARSVGGGAAVCNAAPDPASTSAPGRTAGRATVPALRTVIVTVIPE